MKRALAMVFLTLLLGSGAAAETERSDPPGRALLDAAYEGDLERVRALVRQGLPVDTTDEDSRTALMWAAFNGHTDVVRFLLDREAKVGARDANGRTALMYASSGPFAETVALLLERGAETNVQGTLEGFTALMTAAAEGQLAVVHLLLEHGADPSIRDSDGDTAETFALEKGHREVAELLREAGSR